MSYHDLSSCTLTEDERCAEAQRIIGMLNVDELNHREHEFVTSMDGCRFCSVKQLFYLRDIKDRYL